jgi:hypothetical protein
MLEKAGNNNNVEILEKNVDKLLSDYRRLTEALAPLGQPDTVTDKPPISREKLKEAYNAILEFSEALDYDSVEYVIKSLDSHSIPDDEAERVKKLKKAALNYDHELIPEILK